MPELAQHLPLVEACYGRAASHTPVWFMRQAGRSQPGYRRLRERHGFLDLVANPELCAEVTVEPVRTLGVDAAIMFADIVTPLIATGIDIDMVDGRGPVVREPLVDRADVTRITCRPPRPDTAHLAQAVDAVRAAVPPEVAVIDFVAAPFTLATYLVRGDGGHAAAQERALRMASEEPAAWQALCDWLVAVATAYASERAARGVDVLMVFDTWIGRLDRTQYDMYARAATRRLVGNLRALGRPVIHFGVGTGHLIDAFAEDGADVIGTDSSLPLDVAWDRVGAGHGIQGNLDPELTRGPWEDARGGVAAVLAAAAGRPGHVFNLGHGVPADARIDTLARIVDAVHASTARVERPITAKA